MIGHIEQVRCVAGKAAWASHCHRGWTSLYTLSRGFALGSSGACIQIPGKWTRLWLATTPPTVAEKWSHAALVPEQLRARSQNRHNNLPGSMFFMLSGRCGGSKSRSSRTLCLKPQLPGNRWRYPVHNILLTPFHPMPKAPSLHVM